MITVNIGASVCVWFDLPCLSSLVPTPEFDPSKKLILVKGLPKTKSCEIQGWGLNLTTTVSHFNDVLKPQFNAQSLFLAVYLFILSLFLAVYLFSSSAFIEEKRIPSLEWNPLYKMKIFDSFTRFVIYGSQSTIVACVLWWRSNATRVPKKKHETKTRRKSQK